MGTAAKLAVNAVVGALNQATAEALLLSTRAGIDAEVFYDVLESSAAGAPYVAYKRGSFLHPETSAVAAPVSLIRKDLGLALDLATRHGLRMPAVEACAEVLEGAFAAGDSDLDMSRIGLGDRAAQPPRRDGHDAVSDLAVTPSGRERVVDAGLLRDDSAHELEDLHVLWVPLVGLQRGLGLVLGHQADVPVARHQAEVDADLQREDPGDHGGEGFHPFPHRLGVLALLFGILGRQGEEDDVPDHGWAPVRFGDDAVRQLEGGAPASLPFIVA